jgi:hypothetical protein
MMKKEADRKKDTVKRRNTGLPFDEEEKLIKEFKEKAMKEIAEAKKNAKKKKGE